MTVYVPSFALSSDIFPVLQVCLGLIRRLCVEDTVGTELTNKLTENLKETLADNKVIFSVHIQLLKLFTD